MPKAKITVQASAEHPDILDIRDAMQQVLDFFELLSAEEDRETLAWNIILATTNSPFTAEAEAVPLQDGVDVRAVASTRISEASEFMVALGKGERPRRTISKKRYNAAKRVWRRNTVGVGKTIIVFDNPKIQDVIVTPAIADIALATSANEEREDFNYIPATRERIENGSIEGIIVDVGTDYNQPAIRVKERKSGDEIACRVDQSVVDDIAKSANFRDVWEHRRIRVRGKISFDANGKIIRVYAKSIAPIRPRTMTTRDVEDLGFTGNFSISEYIDRLREGTIG